MRKTKTVQVERSETESITCDYCGDLMHEDSNQCFWVDYRYAEDSIGDHTFKDVCYKLSCIAAFIEEAKEDMEGYEDTATISIRIDLKYDKELQDYK